MKILRYKLLVRTLELEMAPLGADLLFVLSNRLCFICKDFEVPTTVLDRSVLCGIRESYCLIPDVTIEGINGGCNL